MVNKKNFGERNKNLSEELFDNGIYYDWVITTAFYASIHFVEDKIFPMKIHGCHCINISDAKRACNMQGRHAARKKLVFEKLGNSVGSRYKWLDDQSRNSRYKTYKINKNLANKAKEYLHFIHKECYAA